MRYCASRSSSTTSTRTPWRLAFRTESETGAGGGAEARGVRERRGRVRVKRAPVPAPSLSAATVPPCSSTRWRTSERPSPSPPLSRESCASSCRNGSNAWERNAGAMPRPESRTTMVISAAPARSRTSTVPPRKLNLIALETRLVRTWCRRSASPIIRRSSPSGRDSRSCRPASSAAGRSAWTALSSSAPISTSRKERLILPADMRCASSRSPISRAWSRALRSMDSSGRPRGSALALPMRSIRTQPRMEVSGVRISWESVARNWSLRRLASSAARCAASARSWAASARAMA